MTQDLALRAESLTRKFGAFVAVDQINLSVGRGTIFGFLGPNGAGKTTTIRMLCGLLAPSGGHAWVDGVDVVNDPEGVKARIGYMSQKFSLYKDLTVEENIRFFADVYLVPRARMDARRDFVLATAGLQGREKLITSTLPLGIQQRLALGCAVLHEPRILFLDEPTAGVDPISRRSFWRLIHGMRRQGVTIFVTTHYMDEAENCGEVAFIQAGRVVGLGPPQTLRAAGDQGNLIRVEGTRREALLATGLVAEATPMGAAWHARLLDPASAPLVEKALRLPVIKVQPTLEDVFLQACRDNAAPGGPS